MIYIAVNYLKVHTQRNIGYLNSCLSINANCGLVEIVFPANINDYKAHLYSSISYIHKWGSIDLLTL